MQYPLLFDGQLSTDPSVVVRFKRDATHFEDAGGLMAVATFAPFEQSLSNVIDFSTIR